ncbi:hypothetical protein [Streptomyces sp. NPDC017890]|uniref:hypothetical protein n=1 Tax=Streptomyces sp. NPDC017890 TaxID=3365015 RepID=UPI0037B91048
MLADGKTTSYTWDPASNLTKSALPNTETEARAYDRAGRLTAVTSAKAGTTVTKTAHTLSPAGLPTHVDITRANVGTTGYDLTYDTAGRLTSGCFPQPWPRSPPPTPGRRPSPTETDSPRVTSSPRLCRAAPPTEGHTALHGVRAPRGNDPVAFSPRRACGDNEAATALTRSHWPTGREGRPLRERPQGPSGERRHPRRLAGGTARLRQFPGRVFVSSGWGPSCSVAGRALRVVRARRPAARRMPAATVRAVPYPATSASPVPSAAFSGCAVTWRRPRRVRPGRERPRSAARS